MNDFGRSPTTQFEYHVKQSPFARSPVDIIIPFHGQYEKVSKLVWSILLATKSNPYQICLVDDGSVNKTFIEKFKKVPQVVIIRNEKQMGYGASLRAGLSITRQPWVIFMHSDCEVIQPNWMIAMGETLLDLKGQGVRIVSARSNNPGEGLHAALTAAPNTVQAHTILEEPYLPLYCAMAHRDLFGHIRGHVKEYPYVGYEDEELFWRMKKFGFKQAVCGTSWVRHFGGATILEMCRNNPSIKQIVENNRELCLSDVQSLYRG